MKSFYLLLCITLLVSSCQSSTDKEEEHIEKELVQEEKELEKEEKDLEKDEKEVDKLTKDEATLSNLDFLVPLKDKYPHDVKLLENGVLETRIIRLIGDEKYKYLKKIWQVEAPIEIKDSLFYAWGMEAHSGGDPSAVIMANLNQNILYIGIRQEGVEKMYAENNRPVPTRLKEWANEQ